MLFLLFVCLVSITSAVLFSGQDGSHQFSPSYSLSWTISQPSGDITFDLVGTKANTWYGIGFTDSSSFYMSGADMIVCAPDGCHNYVGTATSKPNIRAADVVRNVNVVAGTKGLNATFMRPNVSTDGYYPIFAGKSSGVIFGFGDWAPGVLSQHLMASVGKVNINFATGATTGNGSTTTLNYLIALGVLVAYVALLAVCAVWWDKGNNNTSVMQATVCVGFLTVLGLWIYLNFLDFQNSGAPVPGYRGVGMGITMCFAVQVLPALVRSTPFAFERAIMYHAASGTALYLTMSVHLVGMWTTYGLDYILNSQQLLYGLLSFIVVTLLMFMAILGRKYNHEAFRFTHVPMAITAYVLAILHYPPLIYWASVVIALFAIDLLWHYFRFYKCAIVDIERKKTFTAVTFVMPTAFTGGQYALFCFPSLSKAQFHPFSLIHKPVPFSQPHGLILITKIKTKGSYTESLNMGTSPAVGESLLLDGPLGRLSHPVDRFQSLFLVSGGVGVTPMLSLVMHYGPTMRPGQRIGFVWCVREIDLLLYVQKILLSVSGTFQCALDVAIHYTGLASDDLGPEVIRGRPNYSAILAAAANKPFTEETPLVTPKKSIQVATGSVGVFICGPAGLADDVQKQCEKNSFDFHREVFEM